MKILHIIDHLGLGGAQSVLREIMEKEKENSMLALALRREKTNISINHPKVSIFASSKKYSLAPLKAIREIVEKEKIDIVHCHLPRAQVFGYFLKKFYFPQIKLVFQEQGDIFSHNFLFCYFLKKIQKEIDFFIAVSEATKRKLLEKAKIANKKIIVIYNFIDNKKFNKQKNNRQTKEIKKDFVIGFAGRLIKRKGWREFLKAAKIISARNLKISFLVAGDGVEKIKLLKTIKKYKLEDKVKYFGYVSDMPNFYMLLDCFVIPSHWEPMGLTELEAQATGVPVIFSDVEGLNEVMKNEVNGLSFEKGNYQELADLMQKIYKDKNLREKIIRNGQENSRNYSVDIFLKKLFDFYKKLLTEN